MHSSYEEMKIKTKTMENGKCPQANLSIEHEKKKVITIQKIKNSFKLKNNRLRIKYSQLCV